MHLQTMFIIFLLDTYRTFCILSHSLLYSWAELVLYTRLKPTLNNVNDDDDDDDDYYYYYYYYFTVDLPRCTSSTCLNGGVCLETIGCKCQGLYQGKQCETGIMKTTVAYSL